MGRVFFGGLVEPVEIFFLGPRKYIYHIPYPGNLIIYIHIYIYIYINLKREIDDKPWNFGVGIAFLEHFWLTIYTPWLVRRTR